MAVKQDEQDPEKIKQKVKSGHLNPCDAHKRIQDVKGPKILSMQRVVDSKRKAQSVDKAASLVPGVTATENQHFEELLKITMKQIAETNQQYKQQKLMEKIKENGSLYAVPSTNENSSITEMKELVANMAPVIAKPEKLFKEQEISELYELMKPQIQKVRDEEEKEKNAR